MNIRGIVSDHPLATTVALLGGLAVAVVVLVWFQPQKLLLNARVDEALPAPAPEVADGPVGSAPNIDHLSPSDAPGPKPGSAAPPDVAAPQRASSTAPAPGTVRRGAFRSLEHATRGSALLVRLGDGTHVVRFEDLDTSNGPDLRVYLSTASAHGRASELNDDFVDLGPLKANQGNHNYTVPAGTDLSRYRSVTIWCRRFSVGFAVAALA